MLVGAAVTVLGVLRLASIALVIRVVYIHITICRYRYRLDRYTNG